MVYADSLCMAFLGKKKQSRKSETQRWGVGEDREDHAAGVLNHVLTKDCGHLLSFPLSALGTDFRITCGVPGILDKVHMTSRSIHSHVLL